MINFASYIPLLEDLLKLLDERSSEILKRRVGIFGKKESLESIGKDFGITRERVRQIENNALKKIRNSEKFTDIKKPIKQVENFLKNNGNLKKENLLFESFTQKEKEKPYFLLLLKIGENFFYSPNNPEFYPFWYTHPKVKDELKKILLFLEEFLQKKNSPLPKEDFINESKEFLKKKLKSELENKVLLSFCEVSKKIEENPFGEIGLVFWKEIKAKTIIEKAYLLLKKKKEPLHFRTIGEYIKEIFGKKINHESLHNELIKDPRFVLVGRGIYALKEWGFKEGTVKDLIKDLLKNGPKTKEEIISEIKKQRFVKESTIILNLSLYFKKKDGKYTL